MKKIITLLLLSCFMVSAYSQDSPQVEDLVTDRPDMTESSICVPHKTLQVETGAMYLFDETDSEKFTGTSYNSTLLRYGLLENFELRFGFAYDKAKRENKSTEMTTEIDGFAPLMLGFKVEICEQDGFRPEAALLAHVTLPRTGAKEFESEYLTPDAIISVSWEINQRLSTGVNLGSAWGDSSAKPSGFYSIACGIALTDKAGLFIENFGFFARDEDTDISIDGGFTFLATPNFQFDIYGGFGLTDIAPDYFVGAGLSFRLPR